MESKRVAIFGGSFDPPHWAHRQVVDFLRGLPQFDEVWILPTFDHPFEKDLSSFKDRATMCELTIAGLQGVSVCPIEKDVGSRPSYTIDTIRALKKRYPDIEFTLVTGSDVKEDLPRWKDYEELKKLIPFYSIPRPGWDPSSPFTDISSTEIRQLIRDGKPYTKYLVPEVAEFIRKKNLYS